MLFKGKLYICTVGLCRRKGGEEPAGRVQRVETSVTGDF